MKNLAADDGDFGLYAATPGPSITIGRSALAGSAPLVQLLRLHRVRSMQRLLCVALCAIATAAGAAECPDHAGTLGTARVLTVDPGVSPRIGRKQFPATLRLDPGEVVLTFDDGPWPTTTPRVLDALKRECVRATFFLLGRNAAAWPELARRELADGHTVGHHSYSHPLLRRMALPRALAEIDRGIAAVEAALYGSAGPPSGSPVTPFFRFPGFASSPALLDELERRRIAVFGADLWVSDWNRMSPSSELAQLMHRLRLTRGGIVLMHDTHPATAAMLPALLRELKRRDYRVVHVVPPPAAAATSKNP
jgi:peptidoglycan/xylan/chitin deacetylase (PgdA/CDA1 family)